MEIFTNRSLWKKIVITFLIVFSLEYIATKPVFAKASDTLEFGGKLISPVASLLVALRRWSDVHHAFSDIRNRR